MSNMACRRSNFLRSSARVAGAILFSILTSFPVLASDTLLITNVNILPMDAPRLMENQALLIRSGVITEIGDMGALKVPADARIIDGGGGFLMPGLSDMHAHIAGPAYGGSVEENAEVAANQLLLYLATGVTMLRDTSGSEAHISYRSRLEQGELVGPDLFFTSPVLEGIDAVWGHAVRLLDPEKVEPLFAAYAADGYWGVKVYHTLSADVFEAVMASAERHGLKVIGHIPHEVGIQRALESGIYSIEHLRGYDFDGMPVEELLVSGGRSVARIKSLASMTDERMEELVGLTVSAGTWNTPTLVVNRFLFDADGRVALASHPRFEVVHPKLRHRITNSNIFDKLFPADVKAAFRELFPYQKKLVRRLNAAGAKLLIGTDVVVSAYVPGFTPIDEMQLIAKSGVPIFDVLQAATIDAAISLGIGAQRGTVAVGKKASLILLDRNPMEDLTHLWSLKGVIHRGQWWELTEIESMLRGQTKDWKEEK